MVEQAPPLLAVRDLVVEFGLDQGTIRAVDEVSLDLHANVTQQMLREADAITAYRTYPHVDMHDTGRLAAKLLERRIKRCAREPLVVRRLSFLVRRSRWRRPSRS